MELEHLEINNMKPNDFFIENIKKEKENNENKENNESKNNKDRLKRFLLDLDEFKEKYEKRKESYSVFDNIVLENLENNEINLKEEINFYKGSLNVFLSPSHGGKTTFLSLFALNSILENKKVLFYTLELSKEKILERLLPGYYNKLKNKEVTFKQIYENKKVFDVTFKKLSKNLFISEADSGLISVEDIKRDILFLKENNINVDIIVIDYIALIKSNDINVENTYLYLGEIAKELHILAKKLDIVILTASQTNRTVFNKEIDEISGMDIISDSKKIYEYADNMIFFIKDSVDSSNPKNINMFMKIVKNRSTGILKTYKINLDFRRLILRSIENYTKE